MKSLIFILLFVLIPALYAQEETLIGKGEIDHGGFGGPVVKFTQVNGDFALLVGARGGWIINHKFVLGLGGYGLTNNVKGNLFLDGEYKNLQMGFGGFELEYIHNSDNLLHWSVYALIGAGAVTSTHIDPIFDYTHWNYEDNHMNSDPFFVASPEMNVMLNVTTFFRLGIGAGYRFIAGTNKFNLQDNDLSGFQGTLTFKFGSF